MFYTNTCSPVKSLMELTNMAAVLRDVIDSDVPIFFEHQRDPEATSMAAFPARDRAAFDAHWQKILADDQLTAKTVLFEDRVAGNVVSFEHDGKRLVGYWIGREFLLQLAQGANP